MGRASGLGWGLGTLLRGCCGALSDDLSHGLKGVVVHVVHFHNDLGCWPLCHVFLGAGWLETCHGTRGKTSSLGKRKFVFFKKSFVDYPHSKIPFHSNQLTFNSSDRLCLCNSGKERIILEQLAVHPLLDHVHRVRR